MSVKKNPTIFNKILHIQNTAYENSNYKIEKTMKSQSRHKRFHKRELDNNTQIFL